MSGPSGMAIDPTLLMFQQARAAAAAAGQQQEGSSTAANEEEDAGQGAQNSEYQTMDPQLSSSSTSAAAAAPAVNGDGGPYPLQPASAAVAVASTSAKTDSLEAAPVDLRDDVELAAFLAKMDDYEPILPDSVTRFYLEKAGFQSSDDRVTRMLGLAAQKFVSDIAKDAYAFARTRTTAGPGRAPGAGNTQGPSAKNKDRSKTVLTMDDLSAALHEYGVDASRAPYYR